MPLTGRPRGVDLPVLHDRAHDRRRLMRAWATSLVEGRAFEIAIALALGSAVVGAAEELAALAMGVLAQHVGSDPFASETVLDLLSLFQAPYYLNFSIAGTIVVYGQRPRGDARARPRRARRLVRRAPSRPSARRVPVLRLADPVRVDALRVLRLGRRTGRAVAACDTELHGDRAGSRAGRTCSTARRSPTRASSPHAGHAPSRCPEDLDPRVTAALAAGGVTALYRHQAEAWEAARRGENVIVTTGTASGKSLAFNLPVLDAIAREPKTRALYLYPTKALSQDQARALAELRLKGLKPAIYDGDTPGERRWQIRKWANVILTNPDMLHVGVLPHHDRWGDVLHNLRYVVVDEAHVYRGVFGSHVANVLRRLRRLARIYDADPQFLLASATIANAGELAAGAHRRAGDGRRARHVPEGRARGRHLEPAAARPRARAAREPPRRRFPPARNAYVAWPAHDLLREEPQGRRADPPLHRRTRRRGDRAATRSLPRRLHARAAARDRAAPRRGRPARRHGDGRARARHRHRPARLCDLGRLPRHRRFAPAAVGTRRAP